MYKIIEYKKVFDGERYSTQLAMVQGISKQNLTYTQALCTITKLRLKAVVMLEFQREYKIMKGY